MLLSGSSYPQRLGRRRYSCRLIASAAAAVVLPASGALAAPITWTGATDTNWATGANWIGNNPPTNDLTTDTAVFNSGFTNMPNAGTTSVAGITVGDSRLTAFTISSATSGSGLSIGGLGIDTSAVASNTYIVTVGANSTNQLTIAAPQTWTTSATSQITAAATVNYASLLTVDGGGTSRFSSANTGAGGVTVNNGVLVINNNTGIGTGTLTINGGSLNTAGVTLTNNNAIVWNGDFTFLATGALNAGTGPLTVSGNRQITINGTANALTIGGAVGGTGSITKAGTGTLFLNGAVNNIGAITNASTGTGGISIGGAIGANVTSVTQNSANSTLTLSGANTFTGGLFIKAGTALANVSNATTVSGAAGPSTSTITLGDSAGGSASLLATTVTVSNPINLGTSAVGTLTIGNSGNNTATFSGPITLNGNNLTFSGGGTTSPQYVVTGGITGTGNLTLTASSNANRTISTGLINNAGSITQVGTNTAATTISAQIGSNVTGVIQNSSATQLTLTNVANSFTNNGTTTFGLQIKAGLVEAQQATTGTTMGTGAVTLGDTSGSANATLQLQGSGATFNNPIVLGGSTGTLTIQTRNSGTAVNLTGGVSGTGNLTLNNGISSNAQPLNITAGSGSSTVNNTGTVTNATTGTGVGGVAISAVIGSNVTGVTQNSSTGPLVLTGNNTYSGTTSVVLGTLLANTSGAANSATGSSSITITGGTLGGSGRVAGAVSVGTAGNVAPGGTATTVGTLTVGANGTALNFADGSTLTYQTGSSGSDLVDLTGSSSTVSFGNTWNLNVTAASGNPVGGTFKLIDYTSTTDPTLPSTINFTGAYQGLVSIDTTNHAVVLSNVSLVPEPGTAGMVALATMGLLGSRRRRRVNAR